MPTATIATEWTDSDVAVVAHLRCLLADGSAKEIRERAGLSTVELGRFLGVEHSTIVRYEAGTLRPSPDLALQYGRVLAILQDVLAEDGDALTTLT